MQFGRFVAAGGVSAFLDVTLLYVLTEFLKVYYMVSVGIAFLVATFVSYVFNRSWVFWSGRHTSTFELFYFLIVSAIGLALNWVVIYGLVEIFTVWYIGAKLFAIGIVAVWNFWCRKKLVFAY
ncbi:MAG: GtrA family protein [Candidatus Vogelbacteria bacterium]|nr:GtrA family protein [Candidatus Vogelbacteria bacterium]